MIEIEDFIMDPPPQMTWADFGKQAISLSDAEDRAGLQKHIDYFIKLPLISDNVERSKRRDLLARIHNDTHSKKHTLDELKLRIEQAVSHVLNPQSFTDKELKRGYCEIEEVEEKVNKIRTARRSVKKRDLTPPLEVEDEKAELTARSSPVEVIDIEPLENEPFTQEKQRVEDPALETHEEQQNHIRVPKVVLKDRFNLEKKLLGDRKIEVIIPPSFPFNFEEEAVMLGLLTLSSQDFFECHFDDNLGFFPGSKGTRVFYIPIPKMQNLYEAIGLRKKVISRTYQEEGKYRAAFESVFLYRHPITVKRERKTINGRPKYQYFCYLENLFVVCRAYDGFNAKSFVALGLEKGPKGNWRLIGDLKDLVVLLNPKIFNESALKDFRRLDGDLFRKVEESRRGLSGGSGRGWKREPQYLTFAYYLLQGGGEHGRTEDGVLFYRSERELGLLMEKLNLMKTYKKSPKKVMDILIRTFEIYKNARYLLHYEFKESRRNLKRKAILYLNVEAFPHLKGLQSTAENR